MSGKKSFSHQIPSAPPGGYPVPELLHQNRGPPPTYEESQTPEYRFPPSYSSTNSGTSYSPHTAISSGYPRQTPLYPQQACQQYVSSLSYTLPASTDSTAPKVVEFDAAARFKGKGAGSITVPPPPPGYQPTPGQLAAMQGLPVILKKKKHSFLNF